MLHLIKITILVLFTAAPIRLMATPVLVSPVAYLLLKTTSTQISHNGLIYNTVTSPYTGTVWLDRNIGASQVCTAPDDPYCYGSYYQWGRNNDGHEKIISATTATRATQINPVQAAVAGKFILGNSDIPYFDWVVDGVDNDGNSRSINWSRLDGSSVCPEGFRVPTIDELTNETTANNANDPFANNIDAFNNFLKFPSTGSRYGEAMDRLGSGGYVWASNGGYMFSSGLLFRSDQAKAAVNERTAGLSVRCVKDMARSAVTHNGTTYYTVTSPYTGKVWLDRNLGASRVCTTADDAECYGDYYQWGRNFDGHENKDSATSIVLAEQIDPVQAEIIAKFVTTTVGPYDWTNNGVDDDGSIRRTHWNQLDGGSVCPAGFRVPTITELRDETLDNSANDSFADNTDAFNSFLRLPSAGYRNPNGSMVSQDVSGMIVSNSVQASAGARLDVLQFLDTGSSTTLREPGFGFSVRCIKN